MKILLVIDGMHPRDGGPPAVVSGSAIALQRLGLDVTVLTTLQPGDEADVTSAWSAMLDQGVTLKFCEPVKLRHVLGLAQPDRMLRDSVLAADVVHIHGFWTPALLLAGKMARRAGIPYFFSTHGLLDVRALMQNRLKWIKKRAALTLLGFRPLFRASSGIIFGSETEASESWLPAPGLRTYFIPNGVDADVGLQPAPDASRAALAAVAPQFDQWKRSLLFYSRFHPGKGPDMLVSAFNTVVPDYPGVGLLLAGIPEDDAYQAYVEQLVTECPAPDQIVMTTELTGPESHFLYSLCDIFVLPSHAEGFSMALTEALAHGRPALITRYCHLPLVASEGAGVIAESTTESIEEALRTILSLTDEELAAMGQNARNLFTSRYTWDRVAEQLEAAYAAGAASAKGSPRGQS